MVCRFRRLHGRPGWATCATLMLASPPALADGGEAALRAAVELDRIEVKGQAILDEQAAFSSFALDQSQILDARVERLQQLFRKVPGMSLNALGFPGVADSISLRGFGNGGHGGDIGFVVDGIPLNEAMSHADGYADLNVLVPLEVESMKVLRGPVSALYGNYNRAGVVVLETRKEGDYRQADLSVGSDGLFDAQVAAGLVPSRDQQLNLAAQFNRNDGFRPQSKAFRGTLAGRWSLQIAPNMDWSVSARAHRAVADNPGYLTAAQFHDDPYGIDPRMKNDGAEKDFATLRTDFNVSLRPDLRLLSFAYGTEQDFTRWFTRGGASAPAWRQREETYDRRVTGIGFNLNGEAGPSVAPLRWVAGVERYGERTDYLKYEDIDSRRRVGLPEYDRRFILDDVAVFAEANWAWRPWLQPALGLRYDRFTGDCDLRGDQTADDPCEEMRAVDHASPKYGLRSQWGKALTARISHAEGFALANETIKYALGSARVSPNVFRQNEIGLRIAPPSSGLSLDLAVYQLMSSSEIVELAPGEYANAGRTRRSGVELQAEWQIVPQLAVTLAWASAHSRVERNPDPTLVGRRVAGVPRHVGSVQLDWQPDQAWDVRLSLRDVGRYFADAANTLAYDGYRHVDLQLARCLNWRNARWYLAIDNVTDRVYATMLSTVGYATGAPRTLRTGLQFSF